MSVRRSGGIGWSSEAENHTCRWKTWATIRGRENAWSRRKRIHSPMCQCHRPHCLLGWTYRTFALPMMGVCGDSREQRARTLPAKGHAAREEVASAAHVEPRPRCARVDVAANRRRRHRSASAAAGGTECPAVAPSPGCHGTVGRWVARRRPCARHGTLPVVADGPWGGPWLSGGWDGMGWEGRGEGGFCQAPSGTAIGGSGTRAWTDLGHGLGALRGRFRRRALVGRRPVSRARRSEVGASPVRPPGPRPRRPRPPPPRTSL